MPRLRAARRASPCNKREQAPALPENAGRASFEIVPVLKCPVWLRQTGRYTVNFNGKFFL
jgi:hypothetical protein